MGVRNPLLYRGIPHSDALVVRKRVRDAFRASIVVDDEEGFYGLVGQVIRCDNEPFFSFFFLCYIPFEPRAIM